MIQMRYPTAALLAFLLLVSGGLAVYFVERSRSPSNPTPAPTERGARDVLPPDRPGRDNPPLVEVVAAWPGSNAEEVERQVTVPLEVTLAGMPRLQTLRSKSVAGLSWLHAQFEQGTDYHVARQEVINRLQLIQPLPTGVSPQIGPRPGGETLRYVLVGPRDALDRPIYTLNDLRTLQDWHLEREFRRLPGVADVRSVGGTVKRYEIVPDPDRLRRFGITLQQFVDTIARSNANALTDPLVHGQAALSVRAIGLFGGGTDCLSAEVLTAADPRKAAALLRTAEQQRLREIRALVVAKVNEQPVTVGDLIDGGRTLPGEADGVRGVVVGIQPRVGMVACSGPGKYQDPDVVQGVVLMRPGEDPRFLSGVQERIREMNTTVGQLLPGVRIELYDADKDGTGSLWVDGIFPLNTSPERMAERARTVAQLLREFPEVDRVVSQIGTLEENEFESSNHLQLFVGLKAGGDVSAAQGRRAELLDEFNHLLSARVPGVGWLTTTKGPEELGLVFPGAGRDLAENHRPRPR